MRVEIKETEKEVIASIIGSFTFRDYDEYTEIINKIKTTSIKRFVINMDKCDFIDSAGLGMLVIANDEMRAKDMKPVLKNVRGMVNDVLYAARFDTLYKIEKWGIVWLLFYH